jgi:hypothetical protein
MRDVPKIEHTLNIRAGLPVMKTKYGITIDEYDYLDIAVDLLRDVKHFGIQPFKAFVKVDKDGYLPVPCDLDILEGIVTAHQGEIEYQDRDVTQLRSPNNDGYYTANTVRNLLEWPVRTLNIIDGQLSYKLEKDRIKLYDDFYRGKEVCIAYTGFMMDDEGYPLITRKQSNAIAAAAAKVVIMRAALSGDQRKAQMLEFIVQEAARTKQAASIAEDISDSELDELMDANTTFNRKAYKRPNKYSR